jgi:hypothetical protein
MSQKGNILQGVYVFFAGLDEALIEFTLNKCHKTVSQKKKNTQFQTLVYLKLQ